MGAAAGLGELREGCHVPSRWLTAGTSIPKEEKPEIRVVPGGDGWSANLLEAEPGGSEWAK